MLTLQESLGQAKVGEFARRLEGQFDMRIVAQFTEGAVFGLLVEAKPDRIFLAARDPLVASSTKVAPAGLSGGSVAEGKLIRVPPGWAIPGLYQVSLSGEFGFEKDMRSRKPAWQDPGWREAEARRTEAVYAVADAIAANYDVRVTHRSPALEASFACAMTEAQARRVSADPRVKFVSESPYGLIDDAPQPRPTSPSPRPIARE